MQKLKRNLKLCPTTLKPRQSVLLHQVASQTTTGRAIENIAGPKLLPRVHKTWGYLVQCFHSSQTPVIVSGLQALVELAQASGGDFLSTRFASDIWPFVQKFIRYGSLQNSAQASSRVSLGRILQPPISNSACESRFNCILRVHAFTRCFEWCRMGHSTVRLC